MASQAHVFIAGVDTLIINAKLSVEEKEGKEQEPQRGSLLIEEQLALWQEQASVNGESYVTPWRHEQQTLCLEPQGTVHYRYLLKNGLIDLMVGPRLKNGAPLRVRFASEYLWRYGVDRVVTYTHAFLMGLVDTYLFLQAAELHLCADVAGLTIPKQYERVFVCRARKERPVKKTPVLDTPIYQDHRLETVQFSGHGSPVSATIYDKCAEIEHKRPEKRWFYPLWRAGGWDGTLPTKGKEKDDYGIVVQDTASVIWRVECRLKRQALHEMDIEDVYEAIEKIPALWAYCVGHAGEKDGWVRMVKPNAHDSNRWRWNTARSWQAVQEAFSEGWRGYADMANIQRERKREVNLDRAEKAIAGYTTTYGAWLKDEIGPDDDVSVVLQRLYEKMQEIWEKKGVDFQALREKKKFVYHIA